MSEQDKDAQEVTVASAVPPASTSGSTLTPPPKAKESSQEIHEKYRKLKRRFFELEEKHKETSTELQRSGERNVKMREERNILLDRIIELEAQPGFVAGADGASLTGSNSSASLRSLVDPRTQTSLTQNLRDAAAEEDADGDADIDPALTSKGGSADGDSVLAPADTPVMVSSTGTRLRIRPVGGEEPSADPNASPSLNPRSISPDSGGMPVDDENDDSGDYSPPQKGTKRTRDSADYNGDSLAAGAPEPKAPRRSSRRSGPTNTAPPSASHSRVIQGPRRSIPSKTAPSGVAGDGGEGSSVQQPPAAQPDADAPPPDAHATNGHNPQPQQQQQQLQQSDTTASSSSIPRPGSLAFNPYYSYLGPAAPMPPGAYNPYAMYIGMPYMPPPNFVPPPQHAPPQQQRPGPDAPRVAKPKRLKAHTVTSKSYSIPMVPRDKKGKPMLPLNVGIMTVINLGDVCMREHFHTERYIFPVGYEVTRRYLSTVDQTAEVVYHCTILDGGDGPKFQIIPSDVPDSPVIAGTATGAWSSIVKRANAIRQRQHSNSVSGPDFFGLGQNTIKHLIQELPNADRLRDYVWQHFVEGGPLGGRHAAVIPALPEEYDAHMLAGPYYPPRARVPTREEGEAPRQSHYPPHIIAQAQQQQQQAQASGSGAGKQRTPTPQQQQMPPGHDPHAHMSTGPSGGANYYLPHTHGQPDDTEPSAPGAPSGAPYLPEAGYPPPNGGGPSYAPANGGGPSYAPANGGGPTYAPATNGNGAGGNNSFASIMNAFPTQDDGGANGNGVPEGGPPS